MRRAGVPISWLISGSTASAGGNGRNFGDTTWQIWIAADNTTTSKYVWRDCHDNILHANSIAKAVGTANIPLLMYCLFIVGSLHQYVCQKPVVQKTGTEKWPITNKVNDNSLEQKTYNFVLNPNQEKVSVLTLCDHNYKDVKLCS